jgi:hypothetical protein
MVLKRRRRLVVGVVSILAGVLVSFALPTGLLKPGAAAELKTVTFKIEGWVCYG